MRETTPQVELIARPSLDLDALERYLKTVGGEAWLNNRREQESELNPGELLVEAAGRACYRSWEPGLNPNVTKIRTDRQEYLRNILRSGHGSVLEHANYTFILSDVSRVFCYDDETEVLTSDGWIPWPKIDGSETFATLNPATDEIEYQQATERFFGEYSGPMYQVCSEQIDLLVTPNHRMWVQKVDTQKARRKEERFGIVEAQDLLHKRVRYQKGGTWRGEESQAVNIAATTRSFVRSDTGTVGTRNSPGVTFPAVPFARFLGWYLAEGCINRHQIVIYQNRGPLLDEIAEVVSDLGLHPYVPPNCQGQVRTACTPLRDFLSELGTSLEKRVPAMVQSWSPRLIREFLNAMIAGDGNIHSSGHQVIYTSSRELADDLQVLAIKAGWSANIRIDDRTGMERVLKSGQRFHNLRPNYIVSIVRESRLRPHVNHIRTGPMPNRWHNESGNNDAMVHYEGGIHCVKVPNGLLFVRRNGKPVVSGNTHELVRHRAGSAFSQESLRFVRLKELPFRIPEVLEPLRPRIISILETLEEFQISAAEELGLDEEGVSFHDKKEATSALRRIAPDGVSTMIIWTANIRTLRHVIEMRTAPGAEEELRTVFNRVGEIMKAEAPMLFGDYEVLEDGSWVSEFRKV
jgi:thymidylate synthase ThyX